MSELLAYTQFYRDKSTPASLAKVITNFYSTTEISAAKKLLISSYQSTVSDSPHCVTRRDLTVRPAHEAEVDDIIGLFDVIDTDEQKRVTFVAANLERIPSYNPEHMNMCSLADRQAQLEASVSSMTAAYQESVDSLAHMSSSNVHNKAGAVADSKLDDFMLSMQKKLDDLSSLVNNVVGHCRSTESFKPSHNVGHVNSRSHDTKIVLFGIAENKNRTAWYNVVADVLHFVAGRKVEISDAFRLGAFHADKIRPILVSLCSVWDKRLVLSYSRKLATSEDDTLKRVYVVADEPVEVRRQKALTRMKNRALRENKTVSVSDDGSRLYVDGVAVYCVTSGRLRLSNSATNAANGSQ